MRRLEPLVSPAVRGMQPSASAALDEHRQALLAEGRRVVNLGLSQSPFPVPEPLVNALRRNAAEKEHLPIRGLQDLRRAVAHYTERREGLDRTAEDVLIGPGRKELMFLLQLVFDGELVVPTPAWISYGPQAQLLGRGVRLWPTRREDGWLLTPEGLDAIGREPSEQQRMVVLNYPSNPTGATFKPDALRALAHVAQEHRLIILSDEIYGELHHKGEHASIARWYPDGTIISGGLSKWCGAGGWRLGTLVFPENLRWLLDAMAAVATETFTSASAPIQYAAIAAFQGSEEIERYLSGARRVLSALGRWCARKLRAAGLDCAQPTGAFYLLPDFSPLAERLRARNIGTSRELCARLLDEEGVAILPGSDFGRPDDELTARLAYVDFDGTRALEAVGVIPREQPLDEVFLKRHAAEVVDAIERICRFARA